MCLPKSLMVLGSYMDTGEICSQKYFIILINLSFNVFSYILVHIINLCLYFLQITLLIFYVLI